MKIAVTGANGALGSEIIKAVVRETGSENVVGITRSPEKATHVGIEININRKRIFV